MNWQDLIERLDKRERDTVEQLINAEKDIERIRLQEKVKVYREEKRDIKKFIGKEETDYGVAQRQAKKTSGN